MLRDFPKKRKIFNIAEMKETEGAASKADGNTLEPKAPLVGSPGMSSPQVTFQPIFESDFGLGGLHGKDDPSKSSTRGLSDSGALHRRLLLRSGRGEWGREPEAVRDPSIGCGVQATEFRYGLLSASQKIELSRFCWGAFRKRATNMLFAWVNCFQRKGRAGRIKKINPAIFDVIESLKRRATHTKFIFRYEPDKPTAARIASALHESIHVDVESIDIFVLANVLKNYIREHLDGLVPIEVFERIRASIVSSDRYTRKALFSYMPFIFSDVERRLIIELFELLRVIDKNVKETEMNIDSLLGLFSLVLHPQAAFTTLDDLEYVQIITRELYRQDFDAIPQAVVVHELVFV